MKKPKFQVGQIVVDQFDGFPRKVIEPPSLHLCGTSGKEKYLYVVEPYGSHSHQWERCLRPLTAREVGPGWRRE